ncbi:hypothetical protein [Frigoribacterium sp. MCBA15_019]|uniref:hypothetical protein n=1 Tax=Frigoribacterium sp. MCBA15_019 TaxID=1898745 RepID=UPI0008DE4BDD|nr:hypothetical protein [Frigoribacterium sp. MCBA15_019]OII23796.1 hypothetical protein BIV04_06885 [Frigoribacterium sp. MCBA15_019]
MTTTADATSAHTTSSAADATTADATTGDVDVARAASKPYLVPLTRERLRTVLDEALVHRNELTGALSQLTFSSPAAYESAGRADTAGRAGTDGPARTDWAVGPFAVDPAFTFTLDGQWPDPDGLGWTSESLYNPSLIEHDGTLHLFYRASPRKESLGSRIGHATLALTPDGEPAPGAAWVDDPANPVVRPTLDDELLGTEDPKVYRAEGRFWLFYNGVFPITEEARVAHPSPGYPVEAVGIDLLVAVSDDLVTWEKLGPIADHEQTRLWAKGAVIPRDEHGNAVRLGVTGDDAGDYLMFVSEGFDGVLHVGRSDDLRHWTFEPVPYLDLTGVGGRLHEVAAAIVTGDGRLVLDVFHDVDGVFAASQALYDVERPVDQLALTPGGSLSWGGLQKIGGRWTFTQGWDAPAGRRDLYFYRADAARTDPAGSHTPAPHTTP